MSYVVRNPPHKSGHKSKKQSYTECLYPMPHKPEMKFVLREESVV